MATRLESASAQRGSFVVPERESATAALLFESATTPSFDGGTWRESMGVRGLGWAGLLGKCLARTPRWSKSLVKVAVPLAGRNERLPEIRAVKTVSNGGLVRLQGEVSLVSRGSNHPYWSTKTCSGTNGQTREVE